jgi:hypothetical protein
VLGKQIGIWAVQGSGNGSVSPPHGGERSRSAASKSEQQVIDPASSQSVGVRSSSHGISFGGIQGFALL